MAQYGLPTIVLGGINNLMRCCRVCREVSHRSTVALCYTAGHNQIKKRNLYERYGIKEYWLVHPIDRVLTVYRLLNGEYGKPELFELTGETQVGVLPEIVIR
jgi:hypothetical protein